ncbi:TPA: RNA polymerase sigma factor [Pseudomonas aeruginosa]|nr:RNA polymerase sigma factor [Pseudomonas aeruginosa]
MPPGKAGGLSSGAKRGSLSALARQLRGRAKATRPLRTPTQAIPDDDRSFICDCFSFTLDPHSSEPGSFPGCIVPFDPAKPTLLSTLVRHYEELVDHVRRRFGDRGMAREVVHDVCVQLLERDEKEDVHTPLALLRKISHDAAVSRYRSDRRRTAWVEAVAELPEVACMAATPMGRHEAEREFQALVDAIATLPPRCQAVFVMHKIHEVPQAQVADRLGISVKTVEKHLHLGLAACRERLGRGEARP